MTEYPLLSGLELFDTLRAENESAWLSRVFLAPTGFEAMRGMRSIIVFGDEGSGKTALRLGLEFGLSEQTGDAVIPLIVEWQPGIQTEMEGEAFVAQFMNEIFDLAAQTLSRHLASKPECFSQASRWGQEAIIWFIHRYLKSDHGLFLLRLEDESEKDLNCLSDIFSRIPKELISPTTPYPRQMTEVVQILKAIEFSGLWVMVDGLESWLELEAASLGKMLTALFSSLALFDIPGFAVKVMAPLALKNLVSTSTGLSRRRFDIYDLEWPKDTLHDLCESRLSMACSDQNTTLESLSEDTNLIPWLEKYGGAVPRGWLEFLRPFVEAYLAQPVPKPLAIEKTAEIHRRFPPRLRMDVIDGKFALGFQPITDLSISSVAILRYLYQHPERACNKEELYYRGLRNLEQEPRIPSDPGWEAPKTIEGIMDTALWRLRQSLEPDQKQPIYIISDRGKGVIRLENAW